MEVSELAQELRNRQLKKFNELKAALPPDAREYYTKEAIINLSDKEIICSYIVCSDCGAWLITYNEALDLIKRCKNAEEFLTKTEDIMRGH